MAKEPLPQSYWLEPDRILAGEHPWAGSEDATGKRVRRLLEAGIDCFIDLTEQGELGSYEQFFSLARGRRNVLYLRKPIRDHGVPDSAEEMQDILDVLERSLAEGRRVYLHCRAGIGRTNVVAGCWIARRFGGEAALRRLNRLWRASARARSWPSVPETDEQSDFVRRWRQAHSAAPAPAVTPAAPTPAPAPSSPPAGELRDRVRGMLLGLAAGDALAHAVHGLPPGAWSDKTAMALCLAESFAVRRGHDAHDQLERYLAWQKTGRWSSTGTCVGISAATSRALAAALWTGIPYSGSHDPARADAEPLARIGPAVFWHMRKLREAQDIAVSCARVTHQAPLTLDAVRLLAALLAGALAGVAKDTLLSPGSPPAPGDPDPAVLRAPISEIAAGGWRGRKPRRLPRARLLAADALESALAAFESGSDLESCLEAAASRPGDALTAAAIVGQLAGAHYGASSLRAARRAGIARAAEIEALADALTEAAARSAGR